MDLSGKTVTVIGAGRSGQAAARLLKNLNARVKVSDGGDPSAVADDFKKWVSQTDIALEFGHTQKFIEDSDLLIVSPGVKADAAPVQWARGKNIPSIAEIELASRICRCPMIAVTGSNGKTTVVSLIKEILLQAGKKVCLCGNNGFPFSDYALDMDAVDYVVVEISSFQLETIVDFKPFISVFLNFSQNHLDRHKDMDEYFSAKKRLFENQDENDYAVLNEDDPNIKDLVSHLRAKVSFFGAGQSSNGDLSRNPNFLAAAEVARIIGIEKDICHKVIDSFRGIEHRLEWVRTLQGSDFINDSKSTTAQAGRWALENMDKPVVMICGGRDKNIDFFELADLVQKKVKTMLVIGEAKEKLIKAFGHVVPVKGCKDLQDAVGTARKSAAPGDAILFSPMCTSFDMFKDFEDRGRVFKQIVSKLN